MKINKIHQAGLISLMLICLILVQIDTVSAQGRRDKKKSNQIEKKEGNRIEKAEDDVELVCAGDGKTLDEAVKMALRSGLEQTYGTFVSSNTTILNDELIKDEIVSLSTGNVRGYEIVSQNQNSNGTWNAVVKAVFSTGKLVSYVKSKGGSTELAGGLFAMYAKMEKMNEAAEVKIIQNLQQQINIIAPTIFDFSIQAGEPKANTILGDIVGYSVPIQIEGRLNENINNLHDVFHNTMQSLSLTPDEVIKRKEAGLNVYPIIVYNKQDEGASGCGNMIYFEYSGWKGCEYNDKNYKLIEAIGRSKTISELESLVKGKTVYFLRTTEMRKRLDRTIDRRTYNFFDNINPEGAFVISDGKRYWIGGGHKEQIINIFRNNYGLEGILGTDYDKTANDLCTACLEKGQLWLKKKYSITYHDLNELSQVKEITIKPLSQFETDKLLKKETTLKPRTSLLE